jgi:SAM-dependent methyltransferase
LAYRAVVKNEVGWTAATEWVACNLCLADRTTLVARHNGFLVVRCRTCGLVYVNPRPRVEGLASLYGDYHARDGADEASWDRLMGSVFRESSDLLCAARVGLGRPRLLDVGCGFGGFVALMRDRGWEAQGVDP